MPNTDAPDLKALGTFIRDRRHTLGLTQSQLADRFGGVQERISILEHGKYGTPSLPSLARLGTALETSLAELLQAAGYPEVAVSVTGQAETQPHRAEARLIPDDAAGRDSGNDAVETSGLSALLAASTELRYLKLALRCNSHTYHATIQAAGSDWLVTVVDDEQATMPTMVGDALVSREGAILAALLEVLQANQPALQRN